MARASNGEPILRAADLRGATALLENEAELLAKQYGIPVATSLLAKSAAESTKASRRLGFPLVMKIVSKDILHKSDVGGVKTNVSSASAVRQAYGEILRSAKKANPKAEIAGVLVQKMGPKGFEFVVGANRDPQFGPTVMFGLGGIYVELLKDVSFRLAPLSDKEAISMMYEIKSSALLDGFRGSKPLDVRSAARTIVAVGKLMEDHDEIDSIDINPLFVYPKGALAVDVRIILKAQKGK